MEASTPDETGATTAEEGPTGVTTPSASPSKAARQQSETSIEENGQEETLQNLEQPGGSPSLPNSNNNHQEQSGVLWKRRDIFKNLWRPRWFVLQSSEHVLTYYLLPNQDALANATINSTPSNSRRKTATSTTPAAVEQQPPTPGTDMALPSMVIDGDVVARGAIYLLGCQVEVNDTLSRPEESLYAFTISPPSSDETECHLAARSHDARAYWVELISHACGTLSTAPQSHPLMHRFSSRASTVGGDESSWKSLDPPDIVFEHVSEPMSARLEQSLETNLELCEDTPELRWTPLHINVREGDNLKAYQRTDLHGRIMIKSTTLVQHHPKQIFNVLIDPTQREHYETNVAENQRLEVLNPFTYFDYYCYKAIWPTSPRDFATVLHWQVLHRSRPTSESPQDKKEDEQQQQEKNDQAIAILSFSCPEADALCSPESNRVRAHLQSSFFLLRLVQPNNQCEMTRILSYDLGGRLKFNKTIMKQQAGIPGVIDRLLTRRTIQPEDRLCTGNELSNENLIDDILEHLPSNLVMPPRRLDFRGTNISNNDKSSPDREHQWIQDAIVLLIPVMFYQVVRNNPAIMTATLHLLDPVLTTTVDPLVATLLFCIGIYLAFRHVMICHLGVCVGPTSPYIKVLGPTTCRFSVDLKGVSRFLHNKEEGKRELLLHSKDHDILVDHVLVTAAARAMAVVASPIQRYVTIPLLFIHNNFRYPESSLDISILSTTTTTTAKDSSTSTSSNSDDKKSKNDKRTNKRKSKTVTEKLVTLENVSSVANMQQVAEQHAAMSSGELDTFSGMAKHVVQNLTSNENWWEQMLWKGHRRAKCLIVIVPDWDQSQHTNTTVNEVDFTPHLAKDVDILVVVGGIHASTKGWISSFNKNSSGDSGKESKEEDNMASALRLPPKQTLFVSVSTNWNASTCRDFAQELQKCIQFPELCDNE